MALVARRTSRPSVARPVLVSVRLHLMLAFASILVASSAVGVSVAVSARTERQRITDREQIRLQSALRESQRTYGASLSAAADDLLVIAELPETLSAVGPADDARYGGVVNLLTQMLLHKATYDQIRVVGNDGRERVRAERAGSGEPVVFRSFTDKSDRYYVRQTFEMESGLVYVSRLDLNVEDGVVERPIKPVYRIATQLTDEDESVVGIVVINVLAAPLIDQMVTDAGLQTTAVPAVFLVDGAGHYLAAPDAAWTWLPQLDPARADGRSMAVVQPAIWSRVRGRGSSLDDRGIVASVRLDPMALLPQRGVNRPQELWLVGHISAESVTALMSGSSAAARARAVAVAILASAALYLVMLLLVRRVRVNSLMRRTALVDELTGVHNRRAIEGEVQRELGRLDRTNSASSIALLDIDRFKLINDTNGHDAGDVVIRGVASVVSKALRKSDTCGRWGGEEFLVLLSDVGLELGATSAERLRKTVEDAEFTYRDKRLRATVSVGVAELRSGTDWEAAYRDADAALYRAKHGGRNRVEFSAAPSGSVATDAI